MVNLPAGFDASLLVNDLAALGVYIVGAYVLYCAAVVILKALK
jgi:hypothetical protein